MPTRTYGTACVTCRNAKIKCTYTTSNHGVCDRCSRTGRQCDPIPSARRRVGAPGAVPRSSHSILGRHTTLHARRPAVPESVTSENSSSYSPNGTIGSVWQQTPPSAAHITAPPPPPPPPESSLLEGGNGPKYLTITPPTFVSHSEDARILSLDSVLNPATRLRASPEPASDLSRSQDREQEQDGIPHNTALPHDDPIAVHILNRPSAQHLISGYFTHFEYNVGFLDPELYTYDYVQRSSSFLFTTLLSISARLFRPDLYPPLRAHAEGLLGRVLLSCDADIENIWAIVCMYYWKEIADKRGYTMVGFAMRLATSSSWNASRRENTEQQDPRQTETQSRKHRDQDRVWLYLSSLDRTLSFFTDRPMAGLKIPPEISSRAWLQGGMNGTYKFGDARALAGEEINIIIKPLYDMITASREEHTWHSISNLSRSLDTFDIKMIAWGEHWGPIFRSCEHTVRSLEPQIHMYCNHVRTHFNTVLLHRTLVEADFVPNAAVQAAVIRSYETALATLKQATIIGKAEVLYYLWDTAHLMIAYTAMVLLKILKQAPGCHGISASEAYAVLGHLTDLHTTAAAAVQTSEGEHREKNNQPTSTIEAQARLLKAILFRIKADVIPLQHRHSTVGDNYEVVGNNNNIQATHTTDNMVHASIEATMPVLPPPVMHEQEPAQHEPPLQGLSEEPLDVSLLTDEMDYLLSSDAVENWFSNAGLLPWDEQGIFKDYR